MAAGIVGRFSALALPPDKHAQRRFDERGAGPALETRALGGALRHNIVVENAKWSVP